MNAMETRAFLTACREQGKNRKLMVIRIAAMKAAAQKCLDQLNKNGMDKERACTELELQLAREAGHNVRDYHTNGDVFTLVNHQAKG